MNGGLTEAEVANYLEFSPDAMVVIDKSGKIAMSNSQADALFSRTHEEMSGLSVDELLPERFRAKHAQHRYRYFTSPQARPMGTGIQLFGLRSDHTEFPIDISLRPVLLGGKQHASAAIRDMTSMTGLTMGLMNRLDMVNQLIQERMVAPVSLLVGRVDMMEGRMSVYEGKMEDLQIKVTEISDATKANKIVLEDIQGKMGTLVAIDQGIAKLRKLATRVTLLIVAPVAVTVIASLLINFIMHH